MIRGNSSTAVTLMLSFLLSCLLFGFATNIDNFGIGISYGIRRYHISGLGNGIIALLSGASTFAAMTLGSWLSNYLPATLAQRFGSGLLIYLGVSALISLLVKQFWSAPPVAEAGTDSTISSHQQLSVRSSLLLGVTLTLTNFGTGVAAGIANLPIMGAVIASTLTSWIAIAGGFWLGHHCIQRSPLHLSRYLELAASCFLVVLGTMKFLEMA